MLTTDKPRYTLLRTTVGAGLLAIALAGCGSTKWGFPYRPDVQQGNWITSEQVAQLQVGMTREQVRFILGTPTLQDIFHANRWDYPYMNKPGYGDQTERRFTAWFENDQLARWEGDQQPNRQPFEAADTGRNADGTVGGPDTFNALRAEQQPQPQPGAQPLGTGSGQPPGTEAPLHRRPILNAEQPPMPEPGVPSPARTTDIPLR